jgi:hypothetical protein
MGHISNIKVRIIHKLNPNTTHYYRWIAVLLNHLSLLFCSIYSFYLLFLSFEKIYFGFGISVCNTIKLDMWAKQAK